MVLRALKEEFSFSKLMEMVNKANNYIDCDNCIAYCKEVIKAIGYERNNKTLSKELNNLLLKIIRVRRDLYKKRRSFLKVA